MKKLAAALLALALVAALAGCTGTAGSKTGIGIVTTLTGSTPAAAGKEGAVKVKVVVCSGMFDKKGKIIGVKFDEMDANVGISAAGAFTTDLTQAFKSKYEMAGIYSSSAASGAVKPWHEQVAALENWAKGKKVSEVVGLATASGVPTEQALKDKVTMNIADYQKALQKAYDNAMRTPAATSDVSSAAASGSSSNAVSGGASQSVVSGASSASLAGGQNDGTHGAIDDSKAASMAKSAA